MNVVVVDVGSVVDLLRWGWGWCAAVSWAGWCTHGSGAAVSTRDGASLFCKDKKGQFSDDNIM